MTATKRSQQQRVTVVMMRRHIEALVAAHVPRDVPVTRCDGIRSARTVWRRDKLLAIWLPPVKSAVSYAVALHESHHGGEGGTDLGDGAGLKGLNLHTEGLRGFR
jgi:hypothetical protein